MVLHVLPVSGWVMRWFWVLHLHPKCMGFGKGDPTRGQKWKMTDRGRPGMKRYRGSRVSSYGIGSLYLSLNYWNYLHIAEEAEPSEPTKHGCDARLICSLCSSACVCVCGNKCSGHILDPKHCFLQVSAISTSPA